jgi:heme-degrading monooxygenase HmoA
MITELARIQIKPGTDADFISAVEKSVPLFRASKGNLGVGLANIIEEQDVYLLTVLWQTLEDHTVDFRASEAFQKWRHNITPYLAAAPTVIHLQPMISSWEPLHTKA